MADRILTPCNVARWWHWYRQVTAPWNVACGSGIVTVNLPSGITLQCDTQLCDDMPLNLPGGSTLQCGRWLWDDMSLNSPKRILHLVSISTISPQSTCHSAPVCEILFKSDHAWQKKMTSCRFSRWQIWAILDFRDPIIDSLKSPIT